jgi:hypothetical protein
VNVLGVRLFDTFRGVADRRRTQEDVRPSRLSLQWLGRASTFCAAQRPFSCSLVAYVTMILRSCGPGAAARELWQRCRGKMGPDGCAASACGGDGVRGSWRPPVSTRGRAG